MIKPFIVMLALLAQGAWADTAKPLRADYFGIARQGWVIDFRSARYRPGRDRAAVRLNSKDVVHGPVCLFGDPPDPLSDLILTRFGALLSEIFGRARPIAFAGPEITDCPPAQRLYIRLYHGKPPGRAFNADLAQLDRDFGIGLRKGRPEPILSPAQANGFFGRKGAAAHMLVKQAGRAGLSVIEREFYASILVEELFQVFSYGMDILKFDRDTPFLSKLQEYPAFLRYLPWDTPEYMQGLTASNPKGLCAFDVFMLHALASSTLETTNSEALLTDIETRFDDLRERTERTLQNADYAPVLDPACGAVPD